MPGPPPERGARERRHGARGSGFRQLAAVPDAKAPAWPLSGADVGLQREREDVAERLAGWQADLEAEDDRRKRYRLRKRVAEAEVELATLDGMMDGAEASELAHWADLWKSPQATLWAESPATVREVALYVRFMTKAEQGDLRAAGEARQLSDRLGINPAAMLRLRIEVENADELAARGRERRKRALAAGSAHVVAGEVVPAEDATFGDAQATPTSDAPRAGSDPRGALWSAPTDAAGP